jgi:uncharacterized membrane protein
MYEALLFLHILSAMVWIGGTTTLQVLVLRAKKSGDGQRLGQMSHESEWLGTRVLLPVSLLLLAAGTGMAVMGPYGFGEPFVIVGLVGFASSVVIGIMLGPLGQAMKKAITEHGVDHPDTRKAMTRIWTMSRVELGVLVIVVLFMIVKPGTEIVLR